MSHHTKIKESIGIIIKDSKGNIKEERLIKGINHKIVEHKVIKHGSNERGDGRNSQSLDR